MPGNFQVGFGAGLLSRDELLAGLLDLGVRLGHRGLEVFERHVAEGGYGLIEGQRLEIGTARLTSSTTAGSVLTGAAAICALGLASISREMARVTSVSRAGSQSAES